VAVTDEAILKIREMLLTGEIGPGDRLAPEPQLAERLGLSRSSLREAIKALEVIRVLDVRRGDGTYVTSLEPGLLLEAVSFVVDLHDDQSVLEILAVRRILESAAAASAAKNPDPQDHVALHDVLASVDKATDVEGLVTHDLEFHRRIAEAGGNGYLASLLESLSSHTIRARIWRGLTQENVVARTLEEHHAILNAIERRDSELASAAMTLHVSGVETWLRNAL
jgi:DNA-binding FadR family transcriptional regulator